MDVSQLIQVISLASMIPDVIRETKDHGWQSVVTNTIKRAEALVVSGHLPKSILEGAEEIVPEIVTNSPLVLNPKPQAPAPAVAVQAEAGGIVGDIDYDKLAAALDRRARSTQRSDN